MYALLSKIMILALKVTVTENHASANISETVIYIDTKLKLLI